MAYLDSAGLSRVWQKIKSLLNGKVDKVDGMGLSQENYSTEEKEKLNTMQESMEFLVSFGNLNCSDGTLVIGSEDKLHIINTKFSDPDLVDNKDKDIVTYLTEQIQNALYAANSYTDDKMSHSIATEEASGLMSYVDKRRLDEIWEAWSTKNFLTVAKE